VGGTGAPPHAADLERHAAQEYLDGFDSLCLPYDRLPNLAAVSAKLERRTGWNATPVSGFMPAPAFFEMLAARRFPTTTWLRSRDSLEYTPEPDIFHDVFGHVPMHAHPVFADFLATLRPALRPHSGRSDSGTHWPRLLVHGRVRPHPPGRPGQGLRQRPHQLQRRVLQRVARGCEVRPFVLDEVLRTPVKVDEMHHLLFAIESFDEIYEAMRTLEARIASRLAPRRLPIVTSRREPHSRAPSGYPGRPLAKGWETAHTCLEIILDRPKFLPAGRNQVIAQVERSAPLGLQHETLQRALEGRCDLSILPPLPNDAGMQRIML
jgi:phenylalanine-4-hydroxylase